MSIAQQVARIGAQQEMAGRAREFVNLCRAIALSRGDPSEAHIIARDYRVLLGPRAGAVLNSGARAHQITPRQKATIPGIDDLSGLAEYQILSAAFLESLRNYGAFDRILPFTKRVPFRVRVGSVTSGATGATVPQQSAKIISKLSLTQQQVDEIKIATVLVLTSELVKFGSDTAGDLFATELSSAVAVQTDLEFLTQLTTGATSFTSNGVTAEHARVDLRGLLAAVTTSSRSRLFLLTTSAICKALSVLHTTAGDEAFVNLNYNGGSIAGIEVVVSDGVPAGDMILLDASQLACASTGIVLDSSQEATVQLDTSPDSPVSGSTNITSLWQMNLVGLRAERFIGIEKLTSSGVAVVTGVSYSGDSPGP